MLESIIIFISVSILVNLFIYRKFLYCEWLLFHDIVNFIITIIFSIVTGTFIGICFFGIGFLYPYCAFFKNSNFIKFIQSQLSVPEETVLPSNQDE